MEQKPIIETLKTLGINELQKLWLGSGGAPSLPPLKWLLVREIAWRIQAQAHGEIDTETRRRLRVAVRSAWSEASGSGRGAKMQSRTRSRVALPAGAKLVRTWRGRKHEVTVIDGGKRFRYCGESF